MPVAINKDGSKVSKQSHAAAIDLENPSKVIFDALRFLGQSPPPEAIDSDLDSLLVWSIKNWNIKLFQNKKK